MEKLEEEDRREYMNLYQQLADLCRDQTRAFDNAMLTVSAAALGLSMTFFTDIVQNPTDVQWIYGAWSFFGLALFSTIISFRTSKAMLEKQLIATGQKYRREKEDQSWRKWAFMTRWLNRFSVVFLSFGVVAFGIFIANNMK